MPEQPSERGRWRLDLHHADVNRFPGVAYVLGHVCGFEKHAGVALADEAQRRSTAHILSCDSRDEAERLVAEIQLLGVRATVSPPDHSAEPS